MMKKLFFILSIILCVCLLTACGRVGYPELPEDATAFEMGTFVDREHDDAAFGAIVYNGRTYIGYGVLNRSFGPGALDSCIGYIIQDENSSSAVDLDNKNRRIYTFTGYEDNDFLMDYDITPGLIMNTASVWRAIDTKNKDINIPGFIESQGYEYWNE